MTRESNSMGRLADSQYEYDLAISFAGEDRAVAEEIVGLLHSRGVKVFYDGFEEANLWGKDLYVHLADVYSKRARFCIMLLSAHYASKAWTNHERRNAQARAFMENEEYILPVRLDDTEIPGIPVTVGYLDLRRLSPQDVADAPVAKLQGIRGAAAGTPKGGDPTASTTPQRSIPMPSIRKEFTDRDKDRFLSEAFSHVEAYFQEALVQLGKCSSGVDASLRKVHGTKFTAVIYLHGNVANRCKIWGGSSSWLGSICYVEGTTVAVDDDSSLNDCLSVEDDEGALRLKAMLSHSLPTGSQAPTTMDAEQAAEHLWRRFTQHLDR